MAVTMAPSWRLVLLAACSLLLASAFGGASARSLLVEEDVAGPSTVLAQQPGPLTDRALQDLVPELPGWGPVQGFRLFSGYVTVDAEAGRHLSYVFVESQSAPSTDPLLLWLNGGPGCSSFGGGFLSELGPWLPKPGGTKLQLNPYAWNREANVLFVESPAFVGFSYSESPSDAIVGDGRTARDMRAFLLGFLERYPHLAELDFYISGESYAGHYLPTLAWEIVQGNKRAAATQAPPQPPVGFINFKGVLLGNPWTDAAIDNLGAVDYWWHHALISDAVALGIKANCDFERIGPLDEHSSTSNPHTKSGACDHFCNVAQGELSGINIYEIYADLCPDEGDDGASTLTSTTTSLLASNRSGATGSIRGRTRQQRLLKALLHQLTQSGAGKGAGEGAAGSKGVVPPLLGLNGLVAPRTSPASSPSSSAAPRSGASATPRSRAAAGGLNEGVSQARRSLKGRLREDDPDTDDGPVAYDPCVDNEVATYLNLPDVQRALHVNVSGDLPGPWTDCTMRITYSREDLLASMLPVWRKLIDVPGLRFLIYSGDVDGIVPVVGTRRWVASLGLPVVRAWRPWLSGPPHNTQVGGYTIEYELPWQKQQQPLVAGTSKAEDGSALVQVQMDAGADAGAGAGVAVDTSQGVSRPPAAPLKGDFVFATVRNAGHMVPYVQPQRALHMVARFLGRQAL